MRWFIASAWAYSSELEELLAQGWEPFGVDSTGRTDNSRRYLVFLRWYGQP